jgi:hypothetical protein
METRRKTLPTSVFLTLVLMKKYNQRLFNCVSIGLTASHALSQDQDAQVFGKTSKGIFIKTSGKWLVFISFEQFMGPLTITLENFDPLFRLVSSENPVRITQQSIYFPDLDATISLEGSQVWQPPFPSAPPVGDPKRYEKLVDFAKEIMANKRGVGLGSLIPSILGMAEAQPTLQIMNGFDLADIQRLRIHIQKEECLSLIEQLSAMLGSGPGLTPSADDFIVGLLLVLNRWHIPPWTTEGLRDLNFQVVEAAYNKTTTLSANLIECATQGLANERLINALDSIATGVAREPDVVAHLLEWGNSSGIDAFVGMTVALKS